MVYNNTWVNHLSKDFGTNWVAYFSDPTQGPVATSMDRASIKVAYHKRSRIFHPDKVSTQGTDRAKKAAIVAFQKLNNMYEYAVAHFDGTPLPQQQTSPHTPQYPQPQQQARPPRPSTPQPQQQQARPPRPSTPQQQARPPRPARPSSRQTRLAIPLKPRSSPGPDKEWVLERCGDMCFHWVAQGKACRRSFAQCLPLAARLVAMMRASPCNQRSHHAVSKKLHKCLAVYVA